MKLIKRLICLFKGHQWATWWREEHDFIIGDWKMIQCNRCGKIKKERIKF